MTYKLWKKMHSTCTYYRTQASRKSSIKRDHIRKNTININMLSSARRNGIDFANLYLLKLMKRGLSQSGFTLVELMVVVSIIAIMAAGIAPAITTAMADGRAGNAAVDLVSLGGRARSETTFTGLAHLLTYTAGQNGGAGQVQLFRGVNNRCNLQTWGVNAALVDSLLMTTYNVGNTHVIDIQPATGNSAQIGICYQPDGAMLVNNGGVANFAPPAANGIGFTITHKVGSAVQGVPRQVFFPYGGTARLDQ
jgi:prepilin-type N-terminal cleavage/methylation domain-containing protein